MAAKKLAGSAVKAVIGVVVVAIVAAGVYYEFFTGDSMKKVTANFTSAVGVYVGTPVKILGVKVGDVTGVKPEADYVRVSMEYDSKYRIRASDATAQEVANSLVSDRYINLGTLIGKNDPATALTSGALIPNNRTSAPAELDDIYAQLDKLSVALGPAGANKGGQSSGALSNLLKVSAANLGGNGTALGDSITNLSKAAKTLSDRRDGLFGTVKNLQKFTAAIKQSDGQVRLFNSQLATVAGDLAAERQDLGSALQQLGLALNAVNTFIKGNQAKFHTDIQGLKTITGILAKQKASLNETLALAPVALANIVHAYYPAYGAIGTRSNLLSLTDDLTPAGLTKLVCSAGGALLNQTPLSGVLTPVCDGLTNVVGGVKTSSKTATKTSSAKSTALAADAIDSGALTTVLNGGIPPGMLVGSGK